MTKNKLITVRINEDVYNQFQIWTQSNNSNISKCLRDYIFNCLNLTQSSQNIDSDIDSDIDSNSYRQLENEVKKLSSQVAQLEDSLYSRLYSCLVSDLSSQKVDSSIDNMLSSQNIDDDIDNDDTDNNGGNVDVPTNDNIADISDNVPDTKKDDITAGSALSESPILPLNEDLGDKVSDDKNKVSESDIVEIGTLKDAIDNVILPELAKGTKPSDIAKLLQGKYLASVNGTSVNWQTSVVDRAIDSRNKGKV